MEMESRHAAVEKRLVDYRAPVGAWLIAASGGRWPTTFGELEEARSEALCGVSVLMKNFHEASLPPLQVSE